MQHRGAAVGPLLGRGQGLVACLGQEGRSADGDGVALDGGSYADGGGGGEVGGRRDVEFSGDGGLADGAGQGVLAVGLRGGGQGQQVILVVGADGGHVGHGGLAGGEGAGLVE